VETGRLAGGLSEVGQRQIARVYVVIVIVDDGRGKQRDVNSWPFRLLALAVRNLES
jgi:hypothetical protein